MPVHTVFSKVLKVGAMALAMYGATTALQMAQPAGFSIAVAQAAERQVRLGLHKSAVIRLPAGVKDVLVGNEDVAEVVLRSRRTMYLFARKIGATNIFLLDASGRPITQLQLSVVLNPDGLRRLLRKALPNADIHVQTMEEQVLLTGTAKTAAEVNKAVQIAQSYVSGIGSKFVMNAGNSWGNSYIKVVNAIKITGKDQVMIKVKLAEVQRNVFKQLRTNFSQINFTKGDLAGTFGFLFPFSLGNTLGSAGGTISYTGNKVQGSAILQAMERDGLMRLLAEPTLTAVSGKPAKFLAGGEAPVVTSCTVDSGTGNTTCTHQYKPVGVALNFTPLVLSEGRISLNVKIQVSEISNKYSLTTVGGNVIQGLEKRETATTVELPSGGTLAIAGMLRQISKQNIDGVPGLKNLPILGALFRSHDFQSQQSELVVLATPYIVTPRNEKKFRTPVDRLNVATDSEAYILGRLHRVYGAPTGPKGARKVYHGDVGFILE